MNSVLVTVVPVFGLIALGYLSGRTGYVGDAGIKGLPEFVFRIAMPVMLFRTIGTAKMPDVAPTAILLTFFGAVAVVWLLVAALTRWPLRRTQGDAAALAMAASFSNSVMLGIPICLAHFGPEAAPILALIVLCDTSALWLIATLHLAASEGTGGRGLGALLASLAARLATNPIIIGCMAGLLWQLTGWKLPQLADTMVTMLANAAIPGALVAMGLALNSYSLRGEGLAVGLLTLLKLVVMPIAAYIVAVYILHLPTLVTGVVTVLAAMPVGANAYLFATAYDRQPAAVSGSIALTTPLALVTISLLLLFLGPARE
jgi:malonate transporter and related proteins